MSQLTSRSCPIAMLSTSCSISFASVFSSKCYLSVCYQFILFEVFLSVPSPNLKWLIWEKRNNSLLEVWPLEAIKKMQRMQKKCPQKSCPRKLFWKWKLKTFKVQFADLPLTLFNPEKSTQTKTKHTLN